MKSNWLACWDYYIKPTDMVFFLKLKTPSGQFIWNKAFIQKASQSGISQINEAKQNKKKCKIGKRMKPKKSQRKIQIFHCYYSNFFKKMKVKFNLQTWKHKIHSWKGFCVNDSFLFITIRPPHSDASKIKWSESLYLQSQNLRG